MNKKTAYGVVLPRPRKNSQKRNKQLYKCKSFGRQFVGGFRLDDEVLKSEYIEGNQTLDQFASKYNVNKSTIGRRFKSMCHVHVISRHKEMVINMDTTYWGRNFGLMVIKDSFRNKILWHKFVRTETITDYLKGVEFLRSHGFIIHGIVCDGLRGLFQSLRQYKVQMCQFHQIMIIRHYLTKKPDMKASQELLAISKMITHTDKEGFIRTLEKWHEHGVTS